MNVLAKSASAWLVYINSSQIETDTQKELVVTGLSEILGVDADSVRTKAEKTKTGYQKIAGEVETDVKETLEAYIDEHSDEKLSTIIGIDPDTKRYYPYSSFASTIIGFTNSDDQGVGGIEMQYDDDLTGVSGRIITAKNAQQGSMSSDYETTYDAKPGESLVLTIDEVIQYYLEQGLEQALVDTGAKYAYGIVMDTDTGAILGMTSKPDFDLNNPRKISNAALSETNERLSEENYIIEAENELKEQKAQIAEQNKLYAKTDEVTCEERKRLDALLSDMYHKTQLNSTEFIDKMRFACILAAYIKRRSNLVMLAEKQENIDVGELSLAIKESFGFLSLTGAECTFDCAVSGKIYGKNAGVFYDFFQACIANYEGLPSAVIVRLSRRGDNLVLRIECDNKAKEIPEKVKSKFEKYNVTIQTDDEEVYYSLTLPEGGAV